MKDKVYINNEGKKVVVTSYEPRGSYKEYIVNIDYYNHKTFKTVGGAERYLKRMGFFPA